MEYFERSASKIYRNTIFLYLRMLFLLVISLYTSRLTLEYLGVIDFGIYNVVAGVITVLSFLSNSMALAVNRFLSFEMGTGNIAKLRDIFSISLKIHFIIALIVVLGGETIGLWFVNNKLVIPEDRLIAANYIYQFSIIAFVFTVLRVPYNAAIIAHEDMKIYSYLGVVEGLLRLSVVFSLKYVLQDRLITYGFLFALLTIGVSLYYGFHCKRKYKECSYKKTHDTKLFKEMLYYAGISTAGNLSSVVLDQGQNILLNIFFGPVVNAARGIAYQVNSAVTAFVGSIYSAATPQITKSFGANDKKYLAKVVNETTILSMIILTVLVIPIVVNLPLLLELWLGEGNVPDSTALFCRLILIGMLLSNSCRPLLISIQSSGNILRVHLYTGLIIIANIPIDYILLNFYHVPAHYIFIVYIISLIFFVLTILYLAKLQLNWEIKHYFFKIQLPLLILALASLGVSTLLYLFWRESLLSCFIEFLTSSVIMGVGSYVFVLPRESREQFNNVMRKYFKQKQH